MLHRHFGETVAYLHCCLFCIFKNTTAMKSRAWGVKWPPSHYECWRGCRDKTLGSAGVFDKIWQEEPLLWRMLFGPKQTSTFPHPFYTCTHVNTFTCWLHTMAWLYPRHQTDICQSPRGAGCCSTRGTQTLSRVQLPTDFAMRKKRKYRRGLPTCTVDPR